MTGPPQEPDAFLPLTHLSYHILLALAGTALHGYAIIQEIARRTDGQLEPETGSLYTAIRRLRDEGLIEIAEDQAEREGGRRGHSYRLTPLGQDVLKAETRRLARLVEQAREKRIIAPATEPRRR